MGNERSGGFKFGSLVGTDGLTNSQRYNGLQRFIDGVWQLAKEVESDGRNDLAVLAVHWSFPESVRRHHKERMNWAANEWVKWVAKDRPGEEGAILFGEFSGERNYHVHGLALTPHTWKRLTKKWVELSGALAKAQLVDEVEHQGERQDESFLSDFRVNLGRFLQYATKRSWQLSKLGMTLRDRTFASGSLAELWEDAFGWASGDPTRDMSGLDDLPTANEQEPDPGSIPARPLVRETPRRCWECDLPLRKPYFSGMAGDIRCDKCRKE